MNFDWEAHWAGLESRVVDRDKVVALALRLHEFADSSTGWGTMEMEHCNCCWGDDGTWLYTEDEYGIKYMPRPGMTCYRLAAGLIEEGIVP